jgi:hypothetical protein
MKSWVWVVVSLLGFSVMLAAYVLRERVDDEAPWASGSIVIGPEASQEDTARVGAIPARVRLLSSNEIAEILLFATGDMAPGKALGVKAHVRTMLIELPLSKVGIGFASLQSGRLPEAGRKEVLAGAGIDPRDTLIVGAQSLKVVGFLKPSLALFANAFLIPAAEPTSGLFSSEVPSVHHAWLVPVAAPGLRDADIRKPLEAVFPPEKYTWVAPRDGLDTVAFHRYLSGLALFLLGGAGACITFFRWLSGKIASPALAAPLLEMKARPRLVWGVHLVYFGLVIAGALLVSSQPDLQTVLLGKVREALTTKNNPLGVASEAYGSGNILRAAVVTLLINFLLGSLAFITLPSVLLPGIGVLLAGLRGIAWGLILAPATVTLALAMLPHSMTMLLEGEGYILATIFGLLIPIHIVRRSLGGTPLTRFGRALLLNLKAQFWIAVVLAVAGLYEATEVILMNR